MAQTNSAVAARYNAPSGFTLGGYRERAFRSVALQIVNAAQNIEAMVSDAADSADKTTLMSSLDTVITNLNSCCAALPNTR